MEGFHLRLTSMESQLVDLDKTKLNIMVEINALRRQMLETCLGTVSDLAQEALRRAENNETGQAERNKLRQIRQGAQEPQSSSRILAYDELRCMHKERHQEKVCEECGPVEKCHMNRALVILRDLPILTVCSNRGPMGQ